MQTSSSKRPTLDRQNALSQYFREMSGRGLLDAKGEAKLALSLREMEEKLWQTVVSQASLVGAVTEFINEHLNEKKQMNFRSLRMAATRFLSAPSKKTEACLDRASLKAAVLLRERDPDQDTVVALLEALDLGLANARE
jgi:hypothetical protein